MLSERSKLQYARSVLRRQYTGASATSGLLVVDKFYRITQFVPGDDFRNVGGTSTGRFCGSGYHRSGQIFQATGTTPTVWTHVSRLTELLVVELRVYSLAVFAEASDMIALTSASFEGGQGSGQLVFEKSLLGLAIEQLLAEFDPDYVATPPMPRRPSGITVRL